MSEWDSWIGRISSTSAWLDPEQANRMSVTLDREPSFAAGHVLPPAWHWLYFHDLIRASDLGEEGHPRLGVTMPPVPLPRRMWAGGSLEFVAPLRLGTVVERRAQVRSITPKNGRSGPLFFVTVQHDFHVDGSCHVRELQTIVYREMSPAAEPNDRETAQRDADIHATWSLDSTALFRYSALTFNGHRIHYDADYCRSVEGYPGLVIHGPMLATLLLDLAVRHDRPLRRFSYRAHSPLFLPDPFTVNGSCHGDRTVLWAANLQGQLAMAAETVGARDDELDGPARAGEHPPNQSVRSSHDPAPS